MTLTNDDITTKDILLYLNVLHDYLQPIELISKLLVCIPDSEDIGAEGLSELGAVLIQFTRQLEVVHHYIFDQELPLLTDEAIVQSVIAYIRCRSGVKSGDDY